MDGNNGEFDYILTYHKILDADAISTATYLTALATQLGVPIEHVVEYYQESLNKDVQYILRGMGKAKEATDENEAN